MSNNYRNYVWSAVHFTKLLCRIITKYQGVFLPVLDSVITDSTDKALVHTMLSAVVAGCAALEKYYPSI